MTRNWKLEVGSWHGPTSNLQPPTSSLQFLGFSLIELVISMAILSVGIVGAIRVFPGGGRASQRSEMTSRAAFLAQRTIESLKLKSWGELIEGKTTSEEDGFVLATNIIYPAPEHLVDASRLKAIEVNVQWTQDGRSRMLTFITYLRREMS